MKRLLPAVALAFLIVPTARAEETTKPIRYTWIATSCETWNCAAATLILANGDKHVLVLPTGREDVPWVILRRVEEGSVYIPEDEPFTCEVFEAVSTASAHFGAMESCRSPLMLTVPDGRMVIASAQNCGKSKRRAVH